MAVHLERGEAAVVAVLAAWKAGAAYVPLDVDYPVARLEQVLCDSAPAALVTTHALSATFAGAGVSTVLIDELIVTEQDHEANVGAWRRLAEFGVTIREWRIDPKTGALAIKDLETRNLIVPVVGDFGGPFAIRAVGAYLKAHDALVSAFYLSNVEQYLNQDGKEESFLCSVAALPLDDTSTFIYTGGGRYGRGFGRGFGGGFGRGGGRGGGLNVTFLRPMLADAQSCTTAAPAAAAPGRLQ